MQKLSLSYSGNPELQKALEGNAVGAEVNLTLTVTVVKNDKAGFEATIKGLELDEVPEEDTMQGGDKACCPMCGSSENYSEEGGCGSGCGSEGSGAIMLGSSTQEIPILVVMKGSQANDD